MLQLLAALRHKVAIGFVGGSNLVKQQEQLGSDKINVTTLFDFCFPENGLSAYRLGVPLEEASFIGWIGEEKYKRLVKFILRYISELDLPVMRGTFVEFRNGMINVSPVGRNASTQERFQFTAFDDEHGIRVALVEALRKEFPDFGLTYVISLPRPLHVSLKLKRKQILDRWPNLLRRFPHRLGQNLLPPSYRKRRQPA
jgi:phosphomannomutase